MVAPAMVITGGTWSDELERWASEPEGFVVAPFTRLNARASTAAGGSAATKDLRPEFRGSWDALIVDEAHYIKGRNTSWTKAVEKIAKQSGATLLMTGTPMPNWAHELYSSLRVIHPEQARPGGPLGAYWSRWLPQWFRLSPSYFNPQAQDIGPLLACNALCSERPATDPCEHFRDFVSANLGDRFLRRRREEVLDLPPLTQTRVATAMDANGKRMYSALKKEYVTTTAGGEDLVAWSDGARNVMLDKITTSPWLLEPEGEPRGGKFDRLRYDLEARAGQPVLVLAHYRDTCNAAARVAQSLGLRAGLVHGGIPEKVKARAVADFKAGRCQVLVGSLETLAEGLTLTVADTAIFVETSYKPSRNEQALRRVHRIGQTRPVTVLDYCTPGSVDEKKRDLLARKTDQQMRVLSAAEFARLL